MDWKLGGLIFACCLAGCEKPSEINSIENRLDAYELQQAELKLKENPVGRYQLIKQTGLPGGVLEWTCLDTATGEIGIAVMDPNNSKNTDFSCAN